MNTLGDKLSFLKQCIEERLKNIDIKRLNYRKIAFRSFIISTSISAIITILLALKIESLNEFVRITSLILTIVVTVINAYNSFFNHKELWIANNIAMNKFYQLKFDIEYAEQNTDTITMDTIDIFKKGYQDILDELNASWQKNRLTEKIIKQ